MTYGVDPQWVANDVRRRLRDEGIPDTATAGRAASFAGYVRGKKGGADPTIVPITEFLDLWRDFMASEAESIEVQILAALGMGYGDHGIDSGDLWALEEVVARHPDALVNTRGAMLANIDALKGVARRTEGKRYNCPTGTLAALERFEIQEQLMIHRGAAPLVGGAL